MRRYINADALIEAIESTDWYHINREGKLVSGARTDLNPLYKAEDILKAVKDASTIDIVRCKECKYWQDYECQCDMAITDHEGGASYSLDRDAEDFCSYGERRGESDDDKRTD